MKKYLLLFALFFSFGSLINAQSLEANKKIARILAENWMTNQVWQYYDEQNFRFEPAGMPAKDFQTFKAEHPAMVAAFPDSKVQVLDLTGEGDKVFIRYRWQGVNKGELMPGVPATGKQIDIVGITVLTFKNGKVVMMQDYFDTALFMQQLGLMPDLAAQPDETAVLAVCKEGFEAFTTYDADRFAAVYAENGVHIDPMGNVHIGREAIRQAHKALFQMWGGKPAGDTYKWEQTKVHFTSPDLAVVNITNTSFNPTMNGTRQEQKATFTIVAVRQNGQWLAQNVQMTPVIPMNDMVGK